MTECRRVYPVDLALHIHIRLLMVINLRCDVEKSFVSAGMPESQEKVSPATAFLPVVSCVSPTLAFGIRVSPVPLVMD